MLSHSLRFALLGAAVIGLMACASGPYEPRNPESTALQVMKAAGYTGLRDTAATTRSDMATPDGMGKAVAWGAGNALAVPQGFSPGSAGAMALISGIIGPKDTDEKIWTSQIVAWMPKDQAETPTVARDKLNGMLWEALSSATHSVQFPDGYTPKEFSWNQDGAILHRVSIHGGECQQKNVYCWMRLSTERRPDVEAAPKILGGFTSYAFAVPFQASYIDRRPFIGQVRAVFPDLAIYQKASAQLPSWVFLYVAPNKVAYDDDGVGRAFLRYPVVLNLGKILYFIKP